MARNTGRGSRVANPDYRAAYPETMWHRRDNSTGRFIDAKTYGGGFKGQTRPRPSLHERLGDVIALTAAILAALTFIALLPLAVVGITQPTFMFITLGDACLLLISACTVVYFQHQADKREHGWQW